MTRRSTLILLAVASFEAGCAEQGRGRFGFGGEEALGLDAGCDPNDSEACTGDGLACTPLLPSSNFTCQLPGAFFPCNDNVGCANSQLQCVDGTCLQSCTTTADCADPLTTCAAQSDGGGSFCLLNSCGEADGGGIWQGCAAPGAGGTCVFLIGNRQSGDQGACLQGGAVPAGGSCQYYRGPDAGLCAPGLICATNAEGANLGICLPVCDPFADGGPSCGSGTACVESAIPAAPPAISYYDYYNHSGVCAQDCVPADAGTTRVHRWLTGGLGYDGGVVDGGELDAGSSGQTDAGSGTSDAGPTDAGIVTPDAGTVAPDAGTAADAGMMPANSCAVPTSCTNASMTGTPIYVCLP